MFSSYIKAGLWKPLESRRPEFNSFWNQVIALRNRTAFTLVFSSVLTLVVFQPLQLSHVAFGTVRTFLRPPLYLVAVRDIAVDDAVEQGLV